MSEADIDAILRDGGSRRRWLLWPEAAAVVIDVAVALFFLLRGSDSTEVVAEPQRAEAVKGQLSTEVELSGSALPERAPPSASRSLAWWLQSRSRQAMRCGTGTPSPPLTTPKCSDG